MVVFVPKADVVVTLPVLDALEPNAGPDGKVWPTNTSSSWKLVKRITSLSLRSIVLGNFRILPILLGSISSSEAHIFNKFTYVSSERKMSTSMKSLSAMPPWRIFNTSSEIQDVVKLWRRYFEICDYQKKNGFTIVSVRRSMTICYRWDDGHAGSWSNINSISDTLLSEIMRLHGKGRLA